MIRVAVLVLGGALALLEDPAPTGPAEDGVMRSFLAQHCTNCHALPDPPAGLRLDDWTERVEDSADLARWRAVQRVLSRGTMPPEDRPRPEQEQVSQALLELGAGVQDAVERGLGATETIHRRLNRREYIHTVSDLLELNLTVDDPTDGFPGDQEQDGFDNLGSELATSAYLLDALLDAADSIIRRAIVTAPRPERRVWSMKPPFDTTNGAYYPDWVKAEREETNEYQSLVQGNKERFGYRSLADLWDGVPVSGRYRVRVLASGHYREHQYNPWHVHTDPGEPMRIAFVSGAARLGPMHINQPGEVVLATVDVPDETPEWREATVWLDAGYQPRLTYPNGPFNFLWIARYLHALYPESGAVGLDFTNWWEVVQTTKTPRIRVFAIEVEGPIVDEWPPASHRILFGDEPFSEERSPKILARFAERAFRRPLREGELDPFLRLVELRAEAGDAPLEALQVGLKAILCAPQFLYLDETHPEDSGAQLDGYALASRLSYFLWSSAPDAELLEAARTGALTDPAERAEAALRMLADPRVARFADEFPERWLRLYEVGRNPPNHSRFKPYYIHDIETAMRTETRLFFQDALERNLPLTVFLHARHTFLNRQLARHYGLPQQDELGAEFELVDSLGTPLRGGLLGQASVLTATADGMDTSPVRRGIWVLENLLGETVPPPPPDIPALERAEREAMTIRQQLERHRADPACASCHDRIDPLGFPLEVFDPVGRLRRTYGGPDPLRIDPSCTLPDGTRVPGLVGFKRLLFLREPQFVRCLTEKMLTYALGRTLSAADNAHVDEIVDRMTEKGEGRGLRDLVQFIVTSPVFERP